MISSGGRDARFSLPMLDFAFLRCIDLLYILVFSYSDDARLSVSTKSDKNLMLASIREEKKDEVKGKSLTSSKRVVPQSP